MPVGTWTVIVDRTPEEVYAYLTDLSRHAEWSPKPYSVEPVTEGPIHVGSRFRSVGWVPRDPNHVNEVEITELHSPSRFAFTAWEQDQAFKSEFTLTPVDGGTQIVRTMDMPKPAGALGVAFPVIFRTVVKPGVQKGMDMLKAKLEAGS
jgi:uncharacterized protein YndB with AHSA1/START domain